MIQLCFVARLSTVSDSCCSVEGSSSRAGRSSGSRSHEHSCSTRRCSYSTKPPLRWMLRVSTWCRQPLRMQCRGARLSPPPSAPLVTSPAPRPPLPYLGHSRTVLVIATPGCGRHCRRTVLIIAHRLSTVQNADVVCVVDKHRIVERGTHAELMSGEHGIYRSLVQRQLQHASECAAAFSHPEMHECDYNRIINYDTLMHIS
eukprot:SAG11_NODE_2604_length_3179_cov_2.347078_2_plen_202_part_00